MSFSMAALLSVAQQELTPASQAGDIFAPFHDKIHLGSHFDNQDEHASSARIPVIQSIENLSGDGDYDDDDESDKEYSMSNDEEQHDVQRKPYGGRPLKFQCPHCDRRFHAPSHLKRHVMSHSSERPFRCDVCDKGFLQAWHLGRHMTTHTGNKPFRCPECPKSFGSRFEMKTHVNYIHKGIKEHQCNVCGKYFTLRSNLKVHMRKHTGEKPYHCSYCSKRFGQRGHLQYHIRKHMSKQTAIPKESTQEVDKKTSQLPIKPTHDLGDLVLHKISNQSQDFDDDSSESDKDSGVESCDFDLESTTSSRASPNLRDLDEQSDICDDIGSLSDRPPSPEFGMQSPKKPMINADMKPKCPNSQDVNSVKPYVCQSCNCGFTEASSLRAHIRHSHPRKGIVIGDYRCAFCLQSYSIVDSLQKHIKEEHQNSNVSSKKQVLRHCVVDQLNRKRHIDSTQNRSEGPKAPSPKALAFSVERLCQKDEPKPKIQKMQQMPQIHRTITSKNSRPTEIMSSRTDLQRGSGCLDMLLNNEYLRRLAEYEQLLSRREKYLNEVAAMLLTNPHCRSTQYPSPTYPGLTNSFRL